ncbi:MAG: hypothetical protein ACFFDW_12340 [Candidatus Thorarchaeota archaeon]
MTTTLGRSDSIQYLLTKWFDQVRDTNADYLEYLKKMNNECKANILENAIELQKYLGKLITKEAITKKNILMENAIKIDPYLIEFTEFIYNYRSLIEEIDGYGLNLESKKKIIDLILSEIHNHEKLKLSFRNLIKAINGVFKQGSKPNKRNELEFEDYLKEFTRIIRGSEKESEIKILNFTTVIKELEIEVENIKKTKQTIID